MSRPPLDHEIVVAGAGPAGLAAGQACRAVGLDVLVVDPHATTPWLSTYAAWCDEVDDAALFAQRWSDVRVIGGSEHRIGRTYGRFDNDLLADRLGAALAAPGRIGAVESIGDSVIVEIDGRSCRAAAVIDARGEACDHLVGAAPPARQRAVGYIGQFSRPVVHAGGCTLMDWSPPGAGAPCRHPVGNDPTFLYALDLGDGRALVEETSLARWPAVSHDVLRIRLDERLAARGIEPVDVERVELVDIPMRTGVPAARLAIPFGAAGGQLHPTTGYSVAASLRAAPRLARLVADARAAGSAGGRLVRDVWQRMWPGWRCRTRALHDYGLAATLALSQSEAMAFFDAYFDLPATLWRPALDVDATPRQVRAMMLRLITQVPGELRRQLIAGDPRLLARSIAPGNGALRRS